MSRYGYFRTFYMSFYSRDLYRDVAENWGAGVVLYLTLLLAISWLITMIVAHPLFRAGVSQFNQQITPQLPEVITIKKGIVTTPENRPYLIKDAKTQDVIAIIDTSGKYTSLEESHAALLITKDTYAHTSDSNYHKIEINTIPTNLNLMITRAQVQQFIPKFMDWMLAIAFPFLLIASLLYRLLQSIVYAIFGKIFAAISGQPLMYSTILKLAMVSITPAIVVCTVLQWAHFILPHIGLMYFALAMIYLIFAIRANRVDSR